MPWVAARLLAILAIYIIVRARFTLLVLTPLDVMLFRESHV